MSITEELKKIYKKVERAKNIECHSSNGCNECPHYALKMCDFEDIMVDIKDLMNAVDPLGMYRN